MAPGYKTRDEINRFLDVLTEWHDCTPITTPYGVGWTSNRHDVAFALEVGGRVLNHFAGMPSVRDAR